MSGTYGIEIIDYVNSMYINSNNTL